MATTNSKNVIIRLLSDDYLIGFTMDASITAPIFPLTALSKQPKAVKEAASRGPVRITENGSGAYVFMSEQALAELIERERADAAYEAYLIDAVQQGASDIEAGRYVASREEVFQQARERRIRHA